MEEALKVSKKSRWHQTHHRLYKTLSLCVLQDTTTSVEFIDWC